ncbi:NAD(P)-dependent oxidoreductase [Kaistia dalseonensis]|uniref:Nucleoside-diphosphate-sugar epimerase n=1 Tax=Kaistia dalseonensis TaxID=410840 RepID=A0ABU0HAP7_9HYPH|nr:NAD(P)-dependent oxidoreductase [Kaistia dalseonensis]MCX5496759.1 NAD(P)-dependent oxidoreductase [Kaistia dalseonensis]MDQ0439384.1 nucleoside-diphosphate-sugar epimerase [Kaistia dalseonensis]
MIVAVTGSSGLLGRAIVDALMAAGHEVRGIDTVPARTAVTSHLTADLTDFGEMVMALKGADVVVHGAAIPRPTGRTATDVFSTNIALAYNAVEACVVLGIRRLIYASSFSVLGFPFFVKPIDIHYLPVDEAHPNAPQDAYALSKTLGEDIIDAAVRRGALDAVSLRMPWIQSAETFLREVGPRRAGKDSGRDLWSYIDARDAAAAFLAAVEGKTTGHVRLFLSAADTYSETPTADLIQAAFGNLPLKKPLPGHAAVIDTDAARAAIGFVPKHSWREYQ